MLKGLRENQKKNLRVPKNLSKKEKQTKWHGDCYPCFYISKYLHIFEA